MTNAESGTPKPSKKAPSDTFSDALSAHPDSEPNPFAEPVVLPLEDVLDLHSVPPRDAHAIVEEYLHECYRQNFLEIRIIHGRGIGVQRAMVRSILERLDFVESFGDAPAEAGGWGATVVTLRKTPTPNRECK